MSRLRQVLGRLREAPILSPTGLAWRAILLALALAALHLAGLQEYTAALALTIPAGTAPSTAYFLCGLYLLTWFAFLALAPTLLLAAGLLALWEKVSPG